MSTSLGVPTDRPALNSAGLINQDISYSPSICRSIPQAPPHAEIGGSMRCFLAALLLSCSLLAQDQSFSPQIASGKGMFYVEGIVYQYVAGTDYTVVVAAHSVLNRKFLAVKVRVYNAGRQSVTVKPEDVVLEDANGGRTLESVPGSEL